MDEEHFYAKPLVAVSQQFFGWITGLGEMIQIIGPEQVKEEYKMHLKKIMDNYR